MGHNKFKKSPLAVSVSIALGVLVQPVVFAQEDNQAIEEVVVTGIRGSLERAADIKRNAHGVVDAISSEDIGKFPDTNLAESLQRISGVSIDRVNNEGAKITVRGFGPEFNLVTLNGRQMPTAALDDRSTRSYDFANIASEGISGVEVYKTGRADIPSGGIGSSINIKTARPLDSPGLKFSLGGKAVMDTSNEIGDDVTPEISGIFSNTFAEDRVGVAISLSRQERDSREQQASTDGWLENVISDGNITDNNQNPYGTTWAPRNYGFRTSDSSRKRTNGQLVLQFSPIDTVTTTLDYTYSEFEDKVERDSFGLWFNHFGNVNSATIDKNGTVVYLDETGGDYATNAFRGQHTKENKSIGFNVEWLATDNLSFEFDYHDSTAEAYGTGTGNNTFFIVGATNIETKSYDATQGTDIPLFDVVWSDGLAQTSADAYDSLFAQANAAFNDEDIKQFQIHGDWNNESGEGISSIEFGLARTDLKNRAAAAHSGNLGAGWYGGNQSVYDSSLFTRVDVSSYLSQFSGGGSDILIPYYYSIDWDGAIAAAGEEFGLELDPGDIDGDHRIQEETTSAYVQFNIESDFNGIPVSITAGLRYETTDVTASSKELVPNYIEWSNATEWRTEFNDEFVYSDVASDYDLFLPNLDIKIEPFDDLVARFSYSKTITRADLTEMRGTSTAVNTNPKLGDRSATRGNPALKPYSSDNLDLSFEYYYSDISYVSVGFFNKEVENFLVTTEETEQVGNLRDPFSGPRAELARTELAAEGEQLTDQNIFDRIVANGGGTAVPDGAGGTRMVVLQNDEDPLIPWAVSVPSNVESASFHGVELAAQHWFGDSGFGVAANLTFVDGDIDYDVARSGFQFALTGLSDSANFVAFYDKDALQARIAYNWRDEFLSGLGQAEGGANQPQFTEAYSQIDISTSYDITDQFTVFAEGINVTDETQRIYGRYSEQLLYARQYGPRYNIGFRYTY